MIAYLVEVAARRGHPHDQVFETGEERQSMRGNAKSREMTPSYSLGDFSMKTVGLKLWSGRLLGLVLIVSLFFSWGCSWTGSMFGSEETPQSVSAEGAEGEAAAEQSREQTPEETDNAGKAASQKSSTGLVQRPERSGRTRATQEGKDGSQSGTTVETQEKETPATSAAGSSEKQEEMTAEKKTETAEEVSGKTPAGTPEQSGKEVAAVSKPESEEPVPPIKAKGVVPLERLDKGKTTPPAATVPKSGKLYYKNTQELHDAIQKAIDSEKFLGYTDPFDAFPVLEGVDTMSAAFIPVDHPNYKVFYHAFFQPEKPFHKRVYGYTVIDMTTEQDYGYFDGNADGVFEQETLDPKIVLDDYLRASGEKGGEAPAKEN